MKPFIPTEEEFETILTALGSHANEQVTALVVKEYLKGTEDITDEAAFIQAFSKTKDKDVEAAVMGQAKVIRDLAVVVQSKMIQFRDYVREHQTAEAIDLLTK